MMAPLSLPDVSLVRLQLAVFCVDCEILSENNTPRCLACGSRAVLNLSRVLGGSLRHQQTAHLIADAELDRLVRSLLNTVPQTAEAQEFVESSAISARHHLRVRHPVPVSVHSKLNAHHYEIYPGHLDLEPGISVIAEKAQALTRATGAAIALREGNEIVCRARTGRTAPDIGCRLQTDRGLSAECARTGEVMICHDTETHPRADVAACRHLGVRSLLVAPLRHLRRTLGVFEVLSSSPNAFDHDDVATMQFLSGMMVAAFSRLSKISSQIAVLSEAGHR